MKMYSIFCDTPIEFQTFYTFMAEYLTGIGINELCVVKSESGDLSPGMTINILEQRDALYHVMEKLARDECFATLGYQESILIIPFEGLQFNVVLADSIPAPKSLGLIEVVDSTDVIGQYWDAYESFGIHEIGLMAT